MEMVLVILVVVIVAAVVRSVVVSKRKQSMFRLDFKIMQVPEFGFQALFAQSPKVRKMMGAALVGDSEKTPFGADTFISECTEEFLDLYNSLDTVERQNYLQGRLAEEVRDYVEGGPTWGQTTHRNEGICFTESLESPIAYAVFRGEMPLITNQTVHGFCLASVHQGKLFVSRGARSSRSEAEMACREFKFIA